MCQHDLNTDCCCKDHVVVCVQSQGDVLWHCDWTHGLACQLWLDNAGPFPNASYLEAQCSQGYGGPLCSVCRQGFGLAGRNLCFNVLCRACHTKFRLQVCTGCMSRNISKIQHNNIVQLAQQSILKKWDAFLLCRQTSCARSDTHAWPVLDHPCSTSGIGHPV